jgi:hypothetical protein
MKRRTSVGNQTAAARAYWTPERMHAAIPADVADTTATANPSPPRMCRRSDSSGAVTSATYVPGYNSGSRPFGSFPLRAHVLPVGWIPNTGTQHDMAFMIIGTNSSGQNVGDVAHTAVCCANAGVATAPLRARLLKPSIKAAPLMMAPLRILITSTSHTFSNMACQLKPRVNANLAWHNISLSRK